MNKTTNLTGVASHKKNEQHKYLKKIIELTNKNVETYKKQREIVMKSNILNENELSKQIKIYDNKKIKLKDLPIVIRFKHGNAVVLGN